MSKKSLKLSLAIDILPESYLVSENIKNSAVIEGRVLQILSIDELYAIEIANKLYKKQYEKFAKTMLKEIEKGELEIKNKEHFTSEIATLFIRKKLLRITNTDVQNILRMLYVFKEINIYRLSEFIHTAYSSVHNKIKLLKKWDIITIKSKVINGKLNKLISLNPDIKIVSGSDYFNNKVKTFNDLRKYLKVVNEVEKHYIKALKEKYKKLDKANT